MQYFLLRSLWNAFPWSRSQLLQTQRGSLQVWNLKSVPASRVNVFQKYNSFKPYSHSELQAGVSLSEAEFMEYLNTVALLPPVRMWSCSAPVSITHSFVVLDISLTSFSFMNLCCEETSETKQTSKDTETVCNRMDRSSTKPMTERQVL